MIGSAVNTELFARTMQQALDTANVSTPTLDQAFSMLEQDAQEMAANGTELISNELTGQLIDEFA